MTTPTVPDLVAEPAPLPEAVILAGGMEMAVYSANGQTVQTVWLRLVPMREMQALSVAYMNEPEEIRLYARIRGDDGKLKELPPGWEDEISDASWHGVICTGRDLNFFRFRSFWERQAKAVAVHRRLQMFPA